MCALLLAANASAQVPIIVDTDIYSDVDDVGAVAILHAMADAGQATIVGMMVNTPSKWGAPCLDAINTYYGRPDIPIGTLKPNDDSTYSKNYTQYIAQNFPNSLQDGNNAPSAVTLYRQLLAAQPNASVVIVSVGTFSNLQALLSSTADSSSALDGHDLVAAKVKRLVIMGGGYPSGAEFNFEQNAPATQAVVGGWPTAMTFDGAEIGGSVNTGSTLSSELPTTSPVRRAYEIYVGANNSRPSWDLTAVLFAVRGDDSVFGEAGAGGHNVVAANGSNMWQTGTSSTQFYLTKSVPDSTIAGDLEALLEHMPQVTHEDAGTTADMTVLSTADMTAPVDAAVPALDATLNALPDAATSPHKSSGCSMSDTRPPPLAFVFVALLALVRAMNRQPRRDTRPVHPQERRR